MIPQADILALQRHQPSDATEAAHLASVLAHLASPESRLLRANQQGHLTASAWIINQAGTHALLLHHAGLERFLQPGGHVDPEDESLFAAALRETGEEAGLKGLIPLSLAPFDVDAHAIPESAKKKEPAHTHYDIRFAFRLPQSASEGDVSINAESKGYHWVEILSIANTADSSLSRMARKSLAFGPAEPGLSPAPPLRSPGL